MAMKMKLTSILCDCGKCTRLVIETINYFLLILSLSLSLSFLYINSAIICNAVQNCHENNKKIITHKLVSLIAQERLDERIGSAIE